MPLTSPHPSPLVSRKEAGYIFRGQISLRVQLINQLHFILDTQQTPSTNYNERQYMLVIDDWNYFRAILRWFPES